MTAGLFNITIAAFLACMSILFSVTSLAEETSTRSKTDIANQSPQAADTSFLKFRFYPESDEDSRYQDILSSNQTLDRLAAQFQNNFKLANPIYFHIQHTKKSQLIEAEIIPGSQIINLPYTFLHTLYQGLNTKYDQQEALVESLFSSTFEFYVWTEVAKIIIQNYTLDTQGKEAIAQDNFASLMMLNQSHPISDFLVDASEAYLLIHSINTSGTNQDMLDELASDQKRYKHILCLTIGFDYLTKPIEADMDHLDDFSLDTEQIRSCQQRYLRILRNWYDALTPALQKNNLLRYWLNQESLSKPQNSTNTRNHRTH